MERKLASIQMVSEIRAIPNADRIEIAHVAGWNCIVSKGEFKAGDLCVYCEIDSFLPEIEPFEFLRISSFKKTDWQGNGFRIKTHKLRGELSQGLIFGLDILQKVGDKFTDRKAKIEVGEDVTDILGIAKYEEPERLTGMGTAIGSKPYGIYTTDEMRVQSCQQVIDELKGKPYYITTKMDGTSVTMYTMNGMFGITGHTVLYKLDDKCEFYKWAVEHNVPESMLALNRNIALQGEFCGSGIQGNRLQLKKLNWFVFNAQNLDTGKMLDFEDLKEIVKEVGVDMVPIDEEGDDFEYTIDELLIKADGKYASGTTREGIVIRPKTETYSQTLDGRLSFKVINNKYLLKHKI